MQPYWLSAISHRLSAIPATPVSHRPRFSFSPRLSPDPPVAGLPRPSAADPRPPSPRCRPAHHVPRHLRRPTSRPGSPSSPTTRCRAVSAGTAGEREGHRLHRRRGAADRAQARRRERRMVPDGAPWSAGDLEHHGARGGRHRLRSVHRFPPARPGQGRQAGERRATAIFGGVLGDSSRSLITAEAGGGQAGGGQVPLRARTARPTGTVNRAATTALFPTAAGIAVATLDAISPGEQADLRRGRAALACRRFDAGPGLHVRDLPLRRDRCSTSPSPRRSPATSGAGPRRRDVRREPAALSGPERGGHPPRQRPRAPGRDGRHRRAQRPHRDHARAGRPRLAPRVQPGHAPRRRRRARPGRRRPSSSGGSAILDSLRQAAAAPARLDLQRRRRRRQRLGGRARDRRGAGARPERPKRSVLFVWHTGEELGLLGSDWFTRHPTVPRDSIVAQLNIDMIGRGDATDLQGRRPRLPPADRLAPALDRARRPRRAGESRGEARLPLRLRVRRRRPPRQLLLPQRPLHVRPLRHPDRLLHDRRARGLPPGDRRARSTSTSTRWRAWRGWWRTRAHGGGPGSSGVVDKPKPDPRAPCKQ